MKQNGQEYPPASITGTVDSGAGLAAAESAAANIKALVKRFILVQSENY
jgi:hypothetical protein